MISINSDRNRWYGEWGGRRIYYSQFPVKDAMKKWLKQASKNIVIIFWGLCESLNPSIALKTALSGQFWEHPSQEWGQCKLI